MSSAGTARALTVRRAAVADVPLILAFIRELAIYEHLEHEVIATEADVHAALFGPHTFAEVALVCLDGKPVGFALYFHTFSTFVGKPGIYLEDLFVRPEARGLGAGRCLFAHLAKTAFERGCARLDWAVLDWNEPSIGFYRSLGAIAQSEWTTYRLDGPALWRLAESQP